MRRREFILKNVLPFHTGWTVLVIIPSMVLYGILYYFLFNFSVSLMTIVTLLYLGTCYLILKAISVKMTIWFDDNYLYLKKNNNRYVKYAKADIIGFCSYDYETKTTQLRNSKIYFKFCMKNTQHIYLHDIEYRSRYDEEKGAELKRLLKEAQKELQFTKIKTKNKFQNIYWYSDH
ncbi:NADH-quinone oxidoreductase subunit M [Chryseobacterium sp. StRB126]|uniref:hypothetical protein n=1 Tax=Chryseobacterium sp. StRB126 TaxID=878220 RepID=UPI0004E98243|nr:hypothetical protein [Chryseobacterium sp. StRB126]BAP30313.1 NADH-quinone oxidoreductase subunit M [Chryseobacterium sp. StRB126]